jgi:hypothetical protein
MPYWLCGPAAAGQPSGPFDFGSAVRLPSRDPSAVRLSMALRSVHCHVTLCGPFIHGSAVRRHVTLCGPAAAGRPSGPLDFGSAVRLPSRDPLRSVYPWLCGPSVT